MKECDLELLGKFFSGIFVIVMGFINPTGSYLMALVLAFGFNIFAGLRADEVKIKLQRIIPPVFVTNFNGNKLKDSLFELLIITVVTYLLKLLVELMDVNGVSAYVVQVLVAFAIYYYFTNGLRNLQKAYPKSKWLRLLYYLITFKFKEFFGSDISNIMDKVEDETKN
jgi:hypothetical protein